jgi:hypothetical protein
VEHLSPDIRPKFSAQIAEEIEPHRHGTLDEPEPDRIEAIRVPEVGKEG